jgi:diacylglycerol kinase (ATP)
MATSGQTSYMTEPSNGALSGKTLETLNGNNHSFTIRGRLQSFRYAWYGIVLMLRSQHNAWLHAFASVCILVMGGLFRLTDGEWCWIILAIVAVWTAEALNTALEFLADAATPEFHPLVKCAKDVAAGGVLISALGSVAIGLLVLGPHLVDFLGKLFF